MKKSVKSSEKQQENKQSELMKVLVQSKTLNNFETNFRFAKEFGLELVKGSATPEQIEVLNVSIGGIEDFIQLLKEKLPKE